MRQAYGGIVRRTMWNRVSQAALLILGLTFLPAATSGQSEAVSEHLRKLGYAPRAPRFSDYPVPSKRRGPGDWLSIGRCDVADYPDGIGYERHVRREARKNGPNFAGRCVVVVCSCGTGCGNLSIVDTRSGYVYSLPGAITLEAECSRMARGVDDHIFFRPDSALLIVVSDLATGEGAATVHPHGCAIRYYRWTGRRLVLIRRTPFHT